MHVLIALTAIFPLLPCLILPPVAPHALPNNSDTVTSAILATNQSTHDDPIGNGPAEGGHENVTRSHRQSSGGASVEMAIRIIFPQPFSSGQAGNIENSGDVCFTPNDTPGVCRSFSECKFYKNYASRRGQAARIRFCRTENSNNSNNNGDSRRLICCPEIAERQGELLVKDGRPSSNQESLNGNPTTMAPMVPQVSPTTATTTLPTSLPPMTASGEATEPIHMPTTTAPIMLQTGSIPNTNSESNVKLPSSIDLSQFDFSSDDSQNVCGAFDATRQKFWPWIVSIGRMSSDNDTIEWLCLGSLITTEYILTTAHCLQGSPNVAAVGRPMVGSTTVDQAGENAVIRAIAESKQFRKYVFPSIYKNIGLVKLKEQISVTSEAAPVCFPFEAGVLDIVDYNGWNAYSIGMTSKGGQHDAFQPGVYKVAKNAGCFKITSKHPPTDPAKKFSNGLKMDVMCGLSNRTSPLCPIEGAPLAVFDPASESYVLVGIGSGDPTCRDYGTKLVFFTRINSFSSWVRGEITDLPTPPPCYA